MLFLAMLCALGAATAAAAPPLATATATAVAEEEAMGREAEGALPANGSVVVRTAAFADEPCVLHKGGVVDCRYRALPAVPAEVPANSLAFFFGGNAVAELHSDFLSRLPLLLLADLSQCGLRRLDPLAFRSTPRLARLVLTGNALSDVSDVQWPPGLLALYLSGNPIHVPADGPFIQSKSLRILSVSHCGLKALPRRMLQGVTNLQMLSAANNSVSEIPDGFFKPVRQLLALDMGHNQLQRLDRDCFIYCPLIAVVLLDGNAIVATDEALLYASAVIWLDLGGNDLRAVGPRTFSKIPNVLLLRLNKCNIEQFDDKTFQELHVLQALELAHNNLKTVDAGVFEGHEHLRRLRLQGNGALALPADGPFLRSAALRHLDLSQCGLAALPDAALAHMPALLQLDLTGNRLTELRPAALRPCVALRKVLLAANPDFRCGGDFRDWLAGSTVAMDVACPDPTP